MAQFSVHEAKTNLSKLIAAAIAGEDVVIARGQSPVVRLVPVKPVGKRQFGRYKGQFAIDERFFEPLSAEELAAWGVE